MQKNTIIQPWLSFPPPPRSPDLLPNKVSQDSPFDIIDNHPLPFVPDASLADRTAAGAEGIITMSGCSNYCLKACILAALESIWGIQKNFLAQLNAVCRLLHPTHPNHLVVIQQTGAGKTHILWTLGVIERGIILIFILLLTLYANVMSKLTCANLSFKAILIQHLDMIFDANKPAYKDLLQ
jgi:hypothetical protein